jgi:exopolysaccharide biosynthesis polyprenyl glycosylphosphotransferase
MSTGSEARRPQDALIERCGNPTALGARQRLRMLAKRAAWIGVVRGSYLVKRLLDIAVCAVLLVVLLPALLLVALAIRLELPGPILFRQTRVGRWGRLFTMWKLRSMFIDAEARKAQLMAADEMAGGVTFKMKNDPRVTRVGRLIRKTSIDELPQLWNVLRGDMSLVGPRPERQVFVDRFSQEMPRYFERHWVKSGLTGWAQVNGLRGNTSIEDRTLYDLHYVENWSVWLDLRILLMTVHHVLRGENAY